MQFAEAFAISVAAIQISAVAIHIRNPLMISLSRRGLSNLNAASSQSVETFAICSTSLISTFLISRSGYLEHAWRRWVYCLCQKMTSMTNNCAWHGSIRLAVSAVASHSHSISREAIAFIDLCSVWLPSFPEQE